MPTPSQSEKEGNPFGIAETQSIRDEAAKLGIATDKLLVTNAQSDLNKQISDIKSMLAQGAQLLDRAELDRLLAPANLVGPLRAPFPSPNPDVLES